MLYLVLYLIGGLFAAFLFMSGVASCEHKKVQSLETSIKANQIEAERILAQKVAENSAKEAADKAFAITLQGDYDAKIRSIAAANRVIRLRDPGGQSCPGSGSPAAANTDIPKEPAPVGQELSRVASDFLYAEAMRADQIRVWAQGCNAYVNKPSVREQVNKLRGIK